MNCLQPLNIRAVCLATKTKTWKQPLFASFFFLVFKEAVIHHLAGVNCKLTNHDNKEEKLFIEIASILKKNGNNTEIGLNLQAFSI